MFVNIVKSLNKCE